VKIDGVEYWGWDDYETQMARRAGEVRRARLAAARQRGSHSKSAWREVLDEVGGVCVRCGEIGYRLQKDHVVPIYAGGSDAIENLQPLCGRCNRAKGPETINWLARWRAGNQVRA
jgi:5-methylcytosine-specific restriction endonuclease McrA